MKTAICCIVKNEHKFIKEWVDYHLGIGIDAIHIFEDFTSDSHDTIFDDEWYDEKVFITPLKNNNFGICDYHSTRTQRYVYEKFFDDCKKGKFDYEWVLFTDVDEFLMFEEGYDLRRLLEECMEWPAIWLSWKMYGASGRISSPHPQIGVLEAYPNPAGGRCDINKWSIKSFVNIKKCRGFITIHEADGGKLTNGGHYNEPQNENLCYDKAWLNHYFTKSWEDFCIRVFKRGNFQNNYRTLDQFFNVNVDMRHIKEKLIKSVRYKHAVGTMWLSREYKLISGGNEKKLKHLQKIIK